MAVITDPLRWNSQIVKDNGLPSAFFMRQWQLLSDAVSASTGVLGATGVSAGTYGGASSYPLIVVGADGRITAATTIELPPAGLTQPQVLARVSMRA